jgi:dTDP-4-dehydrorhamnose reductase
LLGVHLALFTRDKHRVTISGNSKNISIDKVNSVNINFLSISEVYQTINTVRPDLIINSAGLTNVDFCESNPDLANFVNGKIPEILAKIAYEHSIKLIHLSTDHLFDGLCSFYNELSSVLPLNNYAKSKYLGENNVARFNPDALIVRTNFTGWGTASRRSFSDWIIDSLRNNKKCFLANDIFITPILIEDFIFNLFELFALNLSGIYHLCGSERISKLNFGLSLAEKFNLNSDFIVATNLKSLNLHAERPHDMSLSNKKACDILRCTLPGVDGLIERLLTQEQSGFSGLISTI